MVRANVTFLGKPVAKFLFFLFLDKKLTKHLVCIDKEETKEDNKIAQESKLIWMNKEAVSAGKYTKSYLGKTKIGQAFCTSISDSSKNLDVFVSNWLHQKFLLLLRCMRWHFFNCNSKLHFVLFILKQLTFSKMRKINLNYNRERD